MRHSFVHAVDLRFCSAVDPVLETIISSGSCLIFSFRKFISVFCVLLDEGTDAKPITTPPGTNCMDLRNFAPSNLKKKLHDAFYLL